MKSQSTLASLLLKVVFMLLFIGVIYAYGQNATLLLITNLILTIVGLCFWHERVEVLRLVLATVGMAFIEIIATSQGIYSYEAAQLVTIPYWLPVGWAFYSLFTFRIINEAIDVFDLEKGTMFVVKNKFVSVISEIMTLGVMIWVSFFFWENTGFCVFGAMWFVVMMCLSYNRRADILIFPVCIAFAVLVEYAGILAGEWQWNAPDLWGLPLWVPVAYSIFLFLFNRMALGIDAILTERAG